MNLFFVVFCLIVLLPNSMSKLIHSRRRLTCKLLNKISTASYVHANEQLGEYYRLGDYSTIFTSPSVNTC